MTTRQLAEYLQLNELTIYKKASTGEIPTIKMGRTLRFKKSIIDKWLELESGWDQEFETLLKRSQMFGKGIGVRKEKIEQAIEEVRRHGG